MTILNVSMPLQSRSQEELLDPSLVELLFSEVLTGQYFNISLVTILVYHSIITLDKEIKFFWSNPCNSVSVIFFANRYIGLLAAVTRYTLELFMESHSSCLFSFWTEGLSALITVVVIDYILLIRVLALFDQERKLSITLKILLGLEAALDLGLFIYCALVGHPTVGKLAEGMTICGVERNPPLAFSVISWATPMVYGLILFSLALYKASIYWKFSSGFKGLHLVRVLIRDQVIYYGFVIFCSVCQIINTTITDIAPLAAYILSAAGSPTLLCVLGGQLLINLKEAGERGVNSGTNYTPRNVSDIEFGERAPNGQSSGHEDSV